MPYSTKTEESIKNLLEDHSNKILVTNMNQVNNRVHVIFTAGILTGIIISYTGLLGFLTGVITGIMVTTNYSVISTNINDIIDKKDIPSSWLNYYEYIKNRFSSNKND